MHIAIALENLEDINRHMDAGAMYVDAFPLVLHPLGCSGVGLVLDCPPELHEKLRAPQREVAAKQQAAAASRRRSELITQLGELRSRAAQQDQVVGQSQAQAQQTLSDKQRTTTKIAELEAELNKLNPQLPASKAPAPKQQFSSSHRRNNLAPRSRKPRSDKKRAKA